MNKATLLGLCASLGILSACATPSPMTAVIPAERYSQRLQQQFKRREAPIAASGSKVFAQYDRIPEAREASTDPSRARLRMVADGEVQPDLPSPEQSADSGFVSNLSAQNGEPEFSVYESSAPLTRDYNGPLSLGDPGVSASLWKESRGNTELFHDLRAWQAMDLITIVVSEDSEGSKEADTEIKSSSTFQAAIENFFGIENSHQFTGDPPDVNLSNLINASAESDVKGEGETTRKGELKAKISAMVVEVLPSGILRIEGEKIISVNNEEQIMIISGLVRTRDISSINEIDSSKVANMRVDYFGRGTVGDAQYGGWLGNVLRRVWPF